MKFNILSYEKNAFERKKFNINRPEGGSFFVFIFFRSPVTLLDRNGITACKENAAILYSPNTKQSYSVPNNDLIHDYITFKMSNPSFFKSINMETDLIFYPHDIEIIDEALKIIKNELHFFPIAHEEMIASTLTKMFIILARDMSNTTKYENVESGFLDSFINLRNDLYANPQNYKVEIMAQKLNFSKAYFSVKYKKYFKITPIEDITLSKMEFVKNNIHSKSPFEISNFLNFDNVTNFYKWFKKCFGATPKQYLNHPKNN